MWLFHLAKLSVLSLFFFFYFKPQDEPCDTNAGVSQLSFPLHRGITKAKSIRSSVKKTCLLCESIGPLPGQQTDLHNTDCVAKQHTYQYGLWLACLFWYLMHTSFSLPFQVEHGIRAPHREICSQ